MHSQVLRQIDRLYERSLAQVTLEAFVVQMHPHMCMIVAGLRKCLVTLGTFERAFAAMCAHMLIVVAGMIEQAAANVALEFLYVRVNESHVRFQMLRQHEGFVALCALKFATADVDFHVRLIVAGVREYLVANGTGFAWSGSGGCGARW